MLTRAQLITFDFQNPLFLLLVDKNIILKRNYFKYSFIIFHEHRLNKHEFLENRHFTN